MTQMPKIETPDVGAAEAFTNPAAAVSRLEALYTQATGFLCEGFEALLAGEAPPRRLRAFYPQVAITTTSFAHIDSRLSFGHVPTPGHYAATITRPDLFRDYLTQQLGLLLKNHGVPLVVGPSSTPIPLHFAFPDGMHVEGALVERIAQPFRDLFDVPDLEITDDAIVNGTYEPKPGKPLPLAPFTAPRVDYSLHRLAHYTATAPEHFQNFVIFTNYQFYIDAFCDLARDYLGKSDNDYEAFVEPGNLVLARGATHPSGGPRPERLPQMPAYHLKGPNHSGITMVNIGVGPSNAKTITDHIAVLRPHAWLMLGHCAGLRNTQALGDYVLAHGYVREDHVLEAGLGFAVKTEKPAGKYGDFLGRDAVLRKKEEGLGRRLLQFRLKDPEPLLYHNEPIWRDGKIAGHLTSGNYGHHLGAAIGLGYVSCENGESAEALLGSAYEIEVAGTRVPAEASLKPLYDPKGERVRG